MIKYWRFPLYMSVGLSLMFLDIGLNHSSLRGANDSALTSISLSRTAEARGRSGGSRASHRGGGARHGGYNRQPRQNLGSRDPANRPVQLPERPNKPDRPNKPERPDMPDRPNKPNPPSHHRPGHRPIPVHVTHYHGGYVYYGRRIAYGATLYDLPGMCESFVINSLRYYYCDGIYYRPYMSGTTTTYVVVEAP